MKRPQSLRWLALFAALLLVAPEAAAQRGRSSGSSGRSGSVSSGRSSGSVRSVRPSSSRPSPSRPSRPSIGSSRSRPSYSPPSRSSGYRPSGSTGIGTLRGSSPGSYVPPSTSRGSTRFLPSGISYDSGSAVDRDSRSGAGRSGFEPGSTYVGTTPDRGTSWYEGRGFSPGVDGSDASHRLPTLPGATSSAGVEAVPSPSRRYGFPRAYRPTADAARRFRYAPESSPTGRRGIDTSTSDTPSDLSDIAARYRGGGSPASSLRDIADRNLGTGSTRVQPGGRRAEGGGRYADGPRGRLNPRGSVQPTGRIAGGTGAGRGGAAAPASGSADGEYESGRRNPGPSGSGPRRPGGGDRIAGAGGVTKIAPSGSVTPGSGGSGGGYVTPGSGGSTIVGTVTTHTYHNYYHHFPHCSSPYYYWSWYAWCAPTFFDCWYWNWRYPYSLSFGYYSYPFGVYAYWPLGYGGYSYSTPVVVENNTVVYGSQEPVVGEGAVEYSNESAARERTPEEAMELSTAADSYLQLGDRAFREGRYGDAVHFYAKAVEFSPDEGALYLVLADSLFATGDYHYAAFAIRKALDLDPTLVDAQVDKHAFYGTPEDFDRQLEVLEGYVQDHPTDTDSRLVLALNFLFGSRAPEAVALLESNYSSSLRSDAAAALILESARRHP